jgi:hypothetical protein
MDCHFIAYLKAHPKVLGISGDSLTFAGSISLAIDALFKKADQAYLAAARMIRRDFGRAAQTGDGSALDPEKEEQKSMDKAVRYAKIGAGLLAFGFALLLWGRILSE